MYSLLSWFLSVCCAEEWQWEAAAETSESPPTTGAATATSESLGSDGHFGGHSKTAGEGHHNTPDFTADYVFLQMSAYIESVGKIFTCDM